MQNAIHKFRQSSLFPRNQVNLSEKLKTLTSFNYRKVYYFLLKFCTRFRLTNVYKSVCDIFKFFFRSWVIDKPGFCECVETRYFFILVNNSSSKQNQKSPTLLFVDIGKKGTCGKFQQKLLKSTVVGAR